MSASSAPRKPPTIAQRYMDALWDASADELTQAEMTMALCYANHARRSDRAWVTDRRLMQQCKVRSAGTVGRVRESLIAKGWIVPLDPASGAPLTDAERRALQGKRQTVTYQLTIPASAPMIGAEKAPSAAPMSGAETDETAPMSESSAPTIERSAPMSEADCSDHRSALSSYSLDPLNNSLSGAERTIADATGATPEETREILFLIRRDNNPRKPDAYVRTLAKNGDLPELLERVRAEARQRAERRNSPPPPPAPEPEESTVTPEERDAAVAAARALLRNARTQTRRGEGGPQRFTPRPDVELPPDVQAAHTYLLGRGDAGDWLEAARAKLGTDAERGDVLVLAAELARA